MGPGSSVSAGVTEASPSREEEKIGGPVGALIAPLWLRVTRAQGQVLGKRASAGG